MGQRPPPFFFGPLAAMVVEAVRLDTLGDDQDQVPLAGEGHHVTMTVVGHPQGLATCFTQLLEWSQGRFVRRDGARSSASHLLSPVGVSLLFLCLSACFSFQLTPPFKPSLPFSQKKTIEEARDGLKAGDVFYYADEFNLSWFPTLRAMWSPVGQQVMIPTPGQPDKYYGIGAVNYYTGESVVLFQRHKRRKEIPLLLEALLEQHPTGTIYVAWDNANTHEDDEVELVVRAAAGHLVLLYLLTYSPWLNPIEMLWRHFRREVTHCELFASVKELVIAALDFFERHNRQPATILSIIGAHPY